jgi:hypothetical protein
MPFEYYATAAAALAATATAALVLAGQQHRARWRSDGETADPSSTSSWPLQVKRADPSFLTLPRYRKALDAAGILFTYKEGGRMTTLARELKLSLPPFLPPFYLRSSHLQTALFSLLADSAAEMTEDAYFQEKVALPDGGSCVLAWLRSKQAESRATTQRKTVTEITPMPTEPTGPPPGDDGLTEDAPVLLLCATITGGAREMLASARAGREERFRCVVYVKRGMGMTQLDTPRLAGFAEPEDLAHCVRLIRLESRKREREGEGRREGALL